MRQNSKKSRKTNSNNIIAAATNDGEKKYAFTSEISRKRHFQICSENPFLCLLYGNILWYRFRLPRQMRAVFGDTHIYGIKKTLSRSYKATRTTCAELMYHRGQNVSVKHQLCVGVDNFLLSIYFEYKELPK